MATLDEIRAQGLGNLIKAGEALTNPNNVKPLPTESIAGLSAAEQQASNLAQSSISGMPDYLSQGVGALNKAANTAQQTMTTSLAGAQMYDPNSYQGFMNPYQQEVIDAYTSEMNRQFGIQGQNRNAQALQAGAFGGGRQGVFEAEASRGFNQQLGQGISQLLNTGYQQAQTQAQNAFQQQQQRMQQSGQNQLGAGQLQQGIGQLFGQFAPTSAQALGTNVETLGKIGSQERGVAQNELNAQYANLMRQYQQPFQNLSFQSGLIGGYPAQQFDSVSNNPLMAGIGNLLGNPGLFGSS